MIPIIYDRNETEFVTNGLGRLSDAISCIVKEEANGSYECTMKYPITGNKFSLIQNDRIITAIPADGKDPQPFVVYKISKPLKGICTIYAEHLSYRLNKIPVMPFEAPNIQLALTGLKDNAAENCPFTFWTDKVIDSPYYQDVPSSIRNRLLGEQGSILQRYKGEYEWDKWTVKLWTNRGHNNGVTIRYGKNLIDLQHEESVATAYTGICPYWTGTNSEDVDIVKMLPEHVLHIDNYESYPYQKTATIDFSSAFEDEPTIDQLRERAIEYMADNSFGVPDQNIQVSFVALWQTEEYKNIAALERVNLFDTVSVVYEDLGVNASATVIETDYDSLSERYEKIVLGRTKANISDALSSIETKTEETVKEVKNGVSHAISEATNIIAGGLGGNVVINRDANGRPIEILVMDTDDKQTAVNVIRFNMSGIGFSQNGYNGPFNSAWTINGTLDMAQINVIHLIADLIQGGTFKVGGSDVNQAGVIVLYDEQNNVIGRLDKTGMRMYGVDGSYVLINTEVGFSGYDRNDNRIYWVAQDEFHMKKSVIEEEITLCGKMRFIPITLYDTDDNVVNDGIGLVSVAS